MLRFFIESEYPHSYIQCSSQNASDHKNSITLDLNVLILGSLLTSYDNLFHIKVTL